MTQININGKLYTWEEHPVSIQNRSFKYGDGLFETIRVINGKMPFLHLHYKRLLAGMQALHMECPAFFSLAYFENEISRLLAPDSHAIVRITVTRSGTGKYLPDDNGVDFFIEQKPLSNTAFELNMNGLQLDYYDEILIPFNKLTRYKTCNKLPYVMAAIYYQQNGFGDVLLLNENLRIAEATSSNVFMVSKDGLTTPPLSEACLEGTMRSVIIDLCNNLALPVNEMPITKAMLLKADEVFLTNAISGIKWVESIGDKKYEGNEMAVRLMGLLSGKFVV